MFNIQGYAERVKAKVIREYVDGSKNRKRWGRDREGEGDGGDGGGGHPIFRALSNLGRPPQVMPPPNNGQANF